MKICFLGAAKTVTGSACEISYKGNYYLVDCGLFQGPKSLRQKNWEDRLDPTKYKAVILTHAHIDHSGFIPRLYKIGYRGPVYCTSATRDLLNIMLPDSGYLQEEDARYLNKNKITSHEPALPLYSEEDARASLELLKVCKRHEDISLDKDLSFQFFRSGHILGSSYIKFFYREDNSSQILTFSGDLGHDRSYVIKGPEKLNESDFLVLESTYGDRCQKREDVFLMLQNIISTIYKKGGTVIIPAFTVGRTQEILYIVSHLKTAGKIPDIPIYIDSPMALDATDLYMKHLEELKLDCVDGVLTSPIKPSNFHAIKSADDSMMLCMSNEAKVVITAAGMLTGGRVLHHLKAKIGDPKSAVVFVGYQVSGTKGALLKNGLLTLRLHKKNYDVEASVFSIDSLSAHADSDELIAFIKNSSKPPKKVILNHGEVSALEALQYRIKNELNIPCKIANEGEYIKL